MKKLLICIMLFICFAQANAQNVAINNDGSLPTIGAMLDVKSSNKGILIPRIALTGTNDISTLPDRPVSLLIYNTATTGGSASVSPGYYYWGGSNWIRLTTNSNSLTDGWLLGGNNGTSPSTHFFGTTDNNALLFRTNNQKSGYLGIEANDANVFWGYQAGNNNTGRSNVAIGVKSLFMNTTSSNLVAIGDSALYNNGLGIGNTVVGSKAMFNNSSGHRNTATGNQSLYANTLGYENTATGYRSLFSNVTGVYNTATGMLAMYSNLSGEKNVATGWNALLSNTGGILNTATGASAMNSNLTGNFNAAHGANSLYLNTTGNRNTANGTAALTMNTIGNGNTASGYSALFSNTTGGDNTAVGDSALYNNSTGNLNTALGYRAVTNGFSNSSALGANALANCNNCLVLGSVTGVNGATSNINVGIGNNAPTFPLQFANSIGDKISLSGNTGPHYGFGIQNSLLQIHSDLSTSDVAVGHGSSGSFIENFRVKGDGNVSLGMSNASATLTFGQALAKKIILFHGGTGGDAALGVFPNELRMQSDYSGAAITFGYDNNPTGFWENMRIEGNGNLQVRASVFANSSFYTSDSRYKKNIEPISGGLDKILQLNAYHYNWKDESQDATLQTGVLAQDVQKLFPELVRTDNKGYLSVNYAGLIPYLIQSIKEQQQQIIQQKNKIDQLSKENDDLKSLRKEVDEIMKQLKLQKTAPTRGE